MARTNTHEEIIRKGAELIHAQGFNATGIQQILQAVCIPKGSFYFYFKSKEDFGLEIIDYFNATISGIFTRYLRESDRELLRRGIRFFPVTLGPMRKLAERGINLRRILEAENFIAIEVYPGGAQDVLGIPRKQKGLEKLKAGLENLGIKGLNSQMSDHELDAVTCAYVGKLFLEGKAVTYGTPSEGIVMPKGETNPIS